MRKVPLRKDVVSNERYDKRELVRVVKNKDGEVSVDTAGKANGRGAYIYLTKENIKLARKNRALDRALETKISEEIYKQLEELYEKKNT